jgi:hypothetical protein
LLQRNEKVKERKTKGGEKEGLEKEGVFRVSQVIGHGGVEVAVAAKQSLECEEWQSQMSPR